MIYFAFEEHELDTSDVIETKFHFSTEDGLKRYERSDFYSKKLAGEF